MIKMKKGFFVFVVVFSLVCGALGVLTVQTLNNEGIINIGSTVQISKDELSAYQNMVDKYSKAELLRTFLEEKYYVDIKDEDLEYGMLSGLVASIGDPYTYYMNEEEYISHLIKLKTYNQNQLIHLLNCSIIDFESLCLAQLLLDISYDTHLSFLVCLDRNSKQTLFLFLHGITFLLDETTNL